MDESVDDLRQTHTRLLSRLRELRAKEIQRNKLIPTLPRPGIVYVLWNEQTGCFKIGFTRDSARARAESIGFQSGCDVEVVAEWKGGRKEELAAHLMFHESRVKGEWFAPTEALCQWILTQDVPMSMRTVEVVP